MGRVPGWQLPLKVGIRFWAGFQGFAAGHRGLESRTTARGFGAGYAIDG